MVVDFYFMAESPPCRAVEMVAKAAGVTLNKKPLNLFTKEHLKEDYAKLNPLHKVPFIVDGDLKLGESRAISAYLVNKYSPDSPLYPKDAVQRALVDELLNLDANLVFRTSSKLFRPLIFGLSKELNADDEKEFRDVLKYFDERLQNNKSEKFLLGNNLTIGDICLAASFSFIEVMDYDVSEFKYLTAYVNNLKASIPDYDLINGKAVENFKAFIKSNQAK